MTLMGITWEFVEKPKWFLLRYTYKGQKSTARCTTKPYKTVNDPVNGIFDERTPYSIEEIEDILLFQTLLKADGKYDFIKLFPTELEDIDEKFLQKYFFYFPYEVVNYVINRFKTEFRIRTVLIPNMYESNFFLWLLDNKLNFIPHTYFETIIEPKNMIYNIPLG